MECTIGPLATGGRCGAPAVVVFGEFAECAEHYRPVAAAPVPRAPRPAFCRKAACVEAAMGPEFVAHRAGECA